MSLEKNKNVIFKFPVSSCEQSMACTGCHQQSFTENSESVQVHNQDVMTYRTSLNPLPRVYYEVFSTYEDQVIDGHILPYSHGICVDQFKTIDEVQKAISCYACGGCGFIVYKNAGWIRTPICVNGWKGFNEDGWF